MEDLWGSPWAADPPSLKAQQPAPSHVPRHMLWDNEWAKPYPTRKPSPGPWSIGRNEHSDPWARAAVDSKAEQVVEHHEAALLKAEEQPPSDTWTHVTSTNSDGEPGVLPSSDPWTNREFAVDPSFNAERRETAVNDLGSHIKADDNKGKEEDASCQADPWTTLETVADPPKAAVVVVDPIKAEEEASPRQPSPDPWTHAPKRNVDAEASTSDPWTNSVTADDAAIKAEQRGTAAVHDDSSTKVEEEGSLHSPEPCSHVPSTSINANSEVSPSTDPWIQKTATDPTVGHPPIQAEALFPIDPSKLDVLHPAIHVLPEPVPNIIIGDTFTPSQRRTWHRLSSYPSHSPTTRLWLSSSTRQRTLDTVRGWMRGDRPGGVIVSGASGSSMFNWDSKAPPVRIGELLGKHARHASVVTPAARAEVKRRPVSMIVTPSSVWDDDDEWGDMVSTPTHPETPIPIVHERGETPTCIDEVGTPRSMKEMATPGSLSDMESPRIIKDMEKPPTSEHMDTAPKKMDEEDIVGDMLKGVPDLSYMLV